MNGTSPYDRNDYDGAGVAPRHLGDTRKRLTNVMRLGVVEEVDAPKGVAKVNLLDGEIITDWLPWMTLRGGRDRFWWAPEPGDTVIMFAPSGDMASAFIWPGTFSNENWNGDRVGLERTTFADGSVVQYERGESGDGRYFVDIQGDVFIRASRSVVIESGAGYGIHLNESNDAAAVNPQPPFPSSVD